MLPGTAGLQEKKQDINLVNKCAGFICSMVLWCGCHRTQGGNAGRGAGHTVRDPDIPMNLSNLTLHHTSPKFLSKAKGDSSLLWIERNRQVTYKNKSWSKEKQECRETNTQNQALAIKQNRPYSQSKIKTPHFPQISIEFSIYNCTTWSIP